jgi:hypothetical protein
MGRIRCGGAVDATGRVHGVERPSVVNAPIIPADRPALLDPPGQPPAPNAP